MPPSSSFHTPASEEGIAAWIRVVNVRIVILLVIMNVIMIGYCRRSGVDADQIRDTTLAIVALYGGMYAWSRVYRRILADDPDPAAAVMERILRDPRRISPLDLAAYWVLFAVIAPPLLGAV